MASVRVHVLGTAQDGGVPHPGCSCARCRAAREERDNPRRVASIAVEGLTGKTFLVDAGPDLPHQLEYLACETGCRRPCVDALAITHAHVGHYVGLAFFGREAMHTDHLPVYGTPSLERFLRDNHPWAHLIEREEIELRTIAPGRPLAFDGAMIHAFLTPHRGEDTDTLGFEIEGPTRRLLYVSDSDVFPPAILDRIRAVDVALIDGTFYSRDELPNRDIMEVPHPFVVDLLPKLGEHRGQVFFTHLNHTNPLLDPASEESRSLPAGVGVAREGMTFEL